MTRPRRLLAVVAAASVFVLAGCGGASEDGTSGTDATATATATATTAAEPSPTADAAGDAENLLVDLPEEYAYADAAAGMEQEMRQRLETSGASDIIDSLAVRNVERGSVPVGAVVAVKLNDNANSADRRSILRGIEEGAGTEGQPVEIDGTQATYIEDGEVKLLLHLDGNDVLMIFGQDRTDIEPILAALAG